MKLIFYDRGGTGHHKNYDAIQRMCKSCSIEFEHARNIERLKENDYNILIANAEFVNPNIIPENIKIIYGPQFFVFPHGPIVGPLNPEFAKRCVANTLSIWVTHMFKEISSGFVIPMIEFPYAVDTDKFAPITCDKEYDCILYIKDRSNKLIEITKTILNNKGIKYIIFKYGQYNETNYINTLHKVKFMLTLGRHESQGFALQEAMSCNVPLLVFDVNSMYDETCNGTTYTYSHMKPKQLLATSVPYWSDKCGIKINNEEELPYAVDKMMASYSTYTPREYVLDTLSNEVCMKRILNYFNL
jgi:glycosyltransferase involved in cell wall biosynthesis